MRSQDFACLFFAVTTGMSCGDDNRCHSPSRVKVSIDSVPASVEVSSAIDVFGSVVIPDDVTVSALRVGARGPFGSPGNGTIDATSMDGFATWKATVALEVLLQPNHGKGLIVLEAISDTNCAPGTVPSAVSAPFEVSYPPDAGIDAPGDATSMTITPAVE